MEVLNCTIMYYSRNLFAKLFSLSNPAPLTVELCLRPELRPRGACRRTGVITWYEVYNLAMIDGSYGEKAYLAVPSGEWY